MPHTLLSSQHGSEEPYVGTFFANLCPKFWPILVPGKRIIFPSVDDDFVHVGDVVVVDADDVIGCGLKNEVFRKNEETRKRAREK